MTLTAVVLFTGWVVGSIGLMTIPGKERTWKSSAVVALLFLCGGEATFLFWHFHPSQTSGPLSGPQFEELSKISSFFGANNEIEWRDFFDFPHMIAKNAFVAKEKIRLRKAGKVDEFYLGNYQGGDEQMFVDFNDGAYDSQGRFEVHVDPHQLEGIIVTAKYLQATRQLLAFENSALVPRAVVSAIQAVDLTASENVSLLLDLINEKLKTDEGYVMYENSSKSKYYKGIDSIFAQRFEPIQPKAKNVIEAIKYYWRAN